MMFEIDKTELPDEYIRALGRLVVRWSQLEDYAARWVVLLAKVDVLEGRSITAHLGIRERLGAAISILEIGDYPRDLAPKFKSIAKHVTECLLVKRNRLIHWLWHISDGVVGQLREESRRGLKIEWEERPLEYITDLIRDIETAMDDLQELSERALFPERPESSPDKSG